jgi:hypothetical protein
VAVFCLFWSWPVLGWLLAATVNVALRLVSDIVPPSQGLLSSSKMRADGQGGVKQWSLPRGARGRRTELAAEWVLFYPGQTVRVS